MAFSADVAGVVALCDAVPTELLSVSSEDYSAYLLSLAAIRHAVEAWSGGNHHHLLLGSYFQIVHGVLRKCPDAVPRAPAAELLFVQDLGFRESLRLDISSIERAMHDAEWKAATVLAGSTTEALLLWALEQREATTPGAPASAALAKGLKVPTALEDWTLHQLLTVADYLKAVTPDTVTAVGLAKNFRNLIHPGRAQRLAEKCTRGTAYSAVGAMERVIDDLS